MNLPLEDAVLIYAKATRSRYGANAVQRTKELMEQLANAGDAEGAKVYHKVMIAIALMDESVGKAGPGSSDRPPFNVS